jgi:hypothetical protein
MTDVWGLFSSSRADTQINGKTTIARAISRPIRNKASAASSSLLPAISPSIACNKQGFIKYWL